MLKEEAMLEDTIKRSQEADLKMLLVLVKAQGRPARLVIEAAKLYREVHGCTLQEAYSAVKQIEAESF